MLAALLVVNAGLGAAAPAGERPLDRRNLTALPVGPAPACVENDGGRWPRESGLEFRVEQGSW